MIHELRTYHCAPGRLPDVVNRFRTVTLGLFSRHGIRATHFWTVAVGPSSSDLVYLIEWDSLAELEQRWSAFQADPEWIAARALSEENGQIIESGSNMLLRPVLTESSAEGAGAAPCSYGRSDPTGGAPLPPGTGPASERDTNAHE